MIRLICTALMFGFLLTTNAQVSETNYGMLKLKHGKKVFGDISKNEDHSFTVTEKNGFEIHVDENEVKRVLDSKEALTYKNGAYHDINGFFWAMNVGLNAGALGADSKYTTVHVEPLFGWRFSKRFLLAAAYGLEVNVNEYETTSNNGQFRTTRTDERIFFSPYMHARYYLTDNKYRLFSFGRMGYGMTLPSFEGGQTNGNGVQFQLGAGVVLPSKNRNKFSISFGWHMQKNEGSRLYTDAFQNPVTADFDLWISRSVLKVGYEFN